MPLIWSVPEALMTYELSSEYPCDSGSVRFVSTEYYTAVFAIVSNFLLPTNFCLLVISLLFITQHFQTEEAFGETCGFIVGYVGECKYCGKKDSPNLTLICISQSIHLNPRIIRKLGHHMSR